MSLGVTFKINQVLSTQSIFFLLSPFYKKKKIFLFDEFGSKNYVWKEFS